MAFANLGFETGSTTPGRPASWAIVLVTNGLLFAEFGTGTPADDAERFETEWQSNSTYVFAFDLTIVPAGFDGTVGTLQGLEDFEQGWGSNETYLFATPEFVAAGLSSGAGFDAFETGWQSNDTYAFTLPASTAASFDSAGTPEAYEDFEELWRSNESYSTTLPASTAASFDSGGTPEAYEDFEESIADTVVSADVTANTLTTAAPHGMANGTRVQFRNDGGRLPAGLDDTTLYYVVSTAALTFQVSMQSGGVAIDITDPGTGTQYVQRSPYAYWRY